MVVGLNGLHGVIVIDLVVAAKGSEHEHVLTPRPNMVEKHVCQNILDTN